MYAKKGPGGLLDYINTGARARLVWEANFLNFHLNIETIEGSLEFPSSCKDGHIYRERISLALMFASDIPHYRVRSCHESLSVAVLRVPALLTSWDLAYFAPGWTELAPHI